MIVHSFNYNPAYEPPAPMIEITIHKTGQVAAEVSLSTLVDSGADATMLPITALQSIGARYVETRQMRGIIGAAHSVDLYLVTVQIGSHTIPAIRAIAAVSNSEPIIGRDVLSQLVVTLNGPASVIEVSS